MKVIICKERKQAYGNFFSLTLTFFRLGWVLAAAQAPLLLHGGLLSVCGVRASLAGFLSLWSVGSRAHGLQQLQLPGPRARAQRLWLMGLAAPRHLGSSWIRVWTRVSCSGRQTHYHWATREAQDILSHQIHKDIKKQWDKITFTVNISQEVPKLLSGILYPALASTLSLGIKYLQAGLALLCIQLSRACQSPAQQDGRFTQC